MKGLREPNLSRELGLNTYVSAPGYVSSYQYFVLRDQSQAFVDRQDKVPWSYLGTNFGNRYETGAIADAANDPANQVDERSLWGTDLVIRLRDNADGGADPPSASLRLRLRIELTGVAPNGRLITERVWIANENKLGAYVKNSYYRTKFAYASVKVRLLEFHGTPTGDDLLHIGFDHANHYSVLNRTNAHYRLRKMGIPWRCMLLEDIGCVKMDPTPVGTGSSDALNGNVRGIYEIDMIGEGAIYDPEDGSIIVNDCDGLKTGHLYDAEGEGFSEAAADLGKSTMVFQTDPRNPPKVQPQDTPLFYDNEIDFYSAPINP